MGNVSRILQRKEDMTQRRGAAKTKLGPLSTAAVLCDFQAAQHVWASGLLTRQSTAHTHAPYQTALAARPPLKTQRTG